MPLRAATRAPSTTARASDGMITIFTRRGVVSTGREGAATTAGGGAGAASSAFAICGGGGVPCERAMTA